MGFVAFSSRRSRLSSDVCYDTCPARGGLPLRPSPSDRSSIELGSQLDRAVRASQSGLSWRDAGSSRK